MKPLRFFLTAAGINLALFLIIYLMPFNPIRSLIGYSTSLFAFLFERGLAVAVVSSKNACILATSTGNLSLYQTFYEFLTILALTIPLYLHSWKKLLEKSVLAMLIMWGYYVLLYGLTILFLENGLNVPWLLRFIRFNTESFMIPAFGALWFFLNKDRILSLIASWKRQ